MVRRAEIWVAIVSRHAGFPPGERVVAIRRQESLRPLPDSQNASGDARDFELSRSKVGSFPEPKGKGPKWATRRNLASHSCSTDLAVSQKIPSLAWYKMYTLSRNSFQSVITSNQGSMTTKSRIFPLSSLFQSK